MSRSREDREHDKFLEDFDGNTAVRIFNGLLTGVVWDYLSVAYPTSTTETYTFREGGSGGTIVSVIAVAYTDATKNEISTVERTT